MANAWSDSQQSDDIPIQLQWFEESTRFSIDKLEKITIRIAITDW